MLMTSAMPRLYQLAQGGTLSGTANVLCYAASDAMQSRFNMETSCVMHCFPAISLAYR